MTLTRKLASLALAGMLSASPLAAFAASSEANPTATPETPSGKPAIKSPETAPNDGNSKGIDGKQGSMSNGADSSTTDGGPSPLGGSKGEGGSSDGGGSGSGK